MARRVNKKFLTILSLIIMGSLLALGAIPLMRKKTDAAILWQRVDQQIAIAHEQNSADAYKVAKESFGKAFRADPNNIEGMIKYGDLLHRLARFDETEIGNDVRAWEQILQIDPRHPIALERLIDSYMELCRIQPEPEGFRRLRERAATLHRVQPENVRAEAYEQIGIVGSWLSGSPTRESEVELAIAKLVDLAKKKPDEVEIPWYVAHG